MKSVKIISIFFIIVLLLVIWKAYDFFNPNYEKCFNQNNSELQERKVELNEINKLVLREISNINIQNNSIDLDDVSEELQTKMEALGFKSFRFELIENCSEKYRIYYTVWENWNINHLNNVEIIYSPCDEETKEGFHSFDGNHIDIFGAGGNWKILSDTDFI